MHIVFWLFTNVTANASMRPFCRSEIKVYLSDSRPIWNFRWRKSQVQLSPDILVSSSFDHCKNSAAMVLVMLTNPLFASFNLEVRLKYKSKRGGGRMENSYMQPMWNWPQYSYFSVYNSILAYSISMWTKALTVISFETCMWLSMCLVWSKYGRNGSVFRNFPLLLFQIFLKHFLKYLFSLIKH